MQDFRKLKVYQKAHELVIEVYKTTSDFPDEEKFGLISQIRRSAVSVPANIAEGCGKASNKGLANYLTISMGSNNETEYYLILAKELGFIGEEKGNELIQRVNEVKAMLISLYDKVKS